MRRTRKTGSSFDEELLASFKRLLSRIRLKDVYRTRVMINSRQFAVKNGLNPRKLCSEVHDRMNLQIQGLPSKEIKKLWELTENQLIRDFLNEFYLDLYSKVSDGAANLIEKGRHPFDAVDLACQVNLPANHKPCLAAKQENVYVQGRRLHKKHKESVLTEVGIQGELDLFPKAS